MNNKDITVALRYLPVVRWLSRIAKDNESLLEVGSGSYGICPYLENGTSVTGVDLDFDKVTHPLLVPVCASATNLPFKDNSFDFAVSMDVLEHLKPEDREKAVVEIVRVAKKGFAVGIPTGRFATRVDKLLDWYYLKTHNEKLNFLSEHLQYPLPSIVNFKSWLGDVCYEKNKNMNFKLEIIGNTNVFLLLALLFLGFSQNKYLCRIFNYSFFLLPILRGFNIPPYYRGIVFVSFLKDGQENF